MCPRKNITTSTSSSASWIGTRMSIRIFKRTLTSNRLWTVRNRVSALSTVGFCMAPINGVQRFSAKELTVEPGGKGTINDPGASGWITVQGKGPLGQAQFTNAGHDSLRQGNRR